MDAKNMRIEDSLAETGFTLRQRFFIECWGSMAHKESTDTDRVGFNNILNAIEEIFSLWELEPKFCTADRMRRAAEELLDAINNDLTLSHQSFKGIPLQINDILTHKNAWSDSSRNPIDKQSGLMQSLFTDLRFELIKHYVTLSAQMLKYEIDLTTVPQLSDYEKISSLSGNLMSFLLTRGMPLSECFILYSRFLNSTKIEKFDDRFDSWLKRISKKEISYNVIFIAENEKLQEMLDKNNGRLIFNNCSYTSIRNGNVIPSSDITSQAIRVAQINRVPCFNKKDGILLSIKVDAISELSARVKAGFILSASSNVVQYFLGYGEIKFSPAFMVLPETGGTIFNRDFKNEILTNTDRLTVDEFMQFMNSISNLYLNASTASVSKMSSAFHFLRNGLDSKIQEVRFTSFWSALEALTKGVPNKGMDHDEHVVYTTSFCMSLDYVVKQLYSLKGIAKYLDIKITNQFGYEVILSELKIVEIYEIIKISSNHLKIKNYLLEHPYADFMLEKFINLCKNPRLMGKKIERHTEKVERHIYRLYMLRNSLIHNAESSLYIDYLTANLEHYLRGTLNAMYYTFMAIPIVRSPEESFRRFLHFHIRIVKQLEPSYKLDANEKKAIEPKISKGEISPDDSLLCEWLRLHIN